MNEAIEDAVDITFYLAPRTASAGPDVAERVERALNSLGVAGHFGKEDGYDLWLWSDDQERLDIDVLSVRPTSEIDDVLSPFKLVLRMLGDSGVSVEDLTLALNTDFDVEVISE